MERKQQVNVLGGLVLAGVGAAFAFLNNHRERRQQTVSGIPGPSALGLSVIAADQTRARELMKLEEDLSRVRAALADANSRIKELEDENKRIKTINSANESKVVQLRKQLGEAATKIEELEKKSRIAFWR